jgi:hypothetical protein
MDGITPKEWKLKVTPKYKEAQQYIRKIYKQQPMDGFEQRELIGDDYWDDPRWKQVRKLRKQNKLSEANSLVFEIRESYGVD